MFLTTILTIFPEMFPGPLSYSILGKSIGKLWDLKVIDIRKFATDKHNKVDDTPYGGGAGMIMKPDIIHFALSYALSLYSKHPKVIYMTPCGVPFSNKIAKTLVDDDGLIILCGRYEGIDHRVIEYWKQNHGMIEISIGDYILFGGELPAMVLIETCMRFKQGIMHNPISVTNESFELDLLEYPQYTKPVVWNGISVPSVLLSGNHKKIELWKNQKAEQITRDIRPDLWNKYLANKNQK